MGIGESKRRSSDKPSSSKDKKLLPRDRVHQACNVALRLKCLANGLPLNLVIDVQIVEDDY